MSTEIEVQASAPPMTAIDIRAQVNRIQEVMKTVMQDGQHYGKIPGAGDKPTLLKAGAEKLIMTFRLAPEVEVEPLFLTDAIGYRVKVKLNTFDGRFVGSGVGECSSLEEKYKWRAAVCEEEFEETPVDQRRIKFSKKYGKVEKIKQVRTNPSDQANTILKMAKKRALVDATLTCLAASDIFTQDIEDMDPETLGNRSVASTPPPPANGAINGTGPGHAKPEDTGDFISDPQRKRLFAIAKDCGVSNDMIKAHILELGIESSTKIRKDQYEEFIAWIEGHKEMAEV
ncbi:MAG: hypothetical protein M0T83_06560 [Nitrospiraceae bacterium]|nr:hypothetical protein [Nitrospiraceae bacterium]